MWVPTLSVIHVPSHTHTHTQLICIVFTHTHTDDLCCVYTQSVCWWITGTMSEQFHVKTHLLVSHFLNVIVIQQECRCGRRLITGQLTKRFPLIGSDAFSSQRSRHSLPCFCRKSPYIRTDILTSTQKLWILQFPIMHSVFYSHLSSC